ncbi:MAG: Ku protein [Chloroflexi bacterium]|nr:Ku protein [Chloroflexota bacterium]
MAKAFWKGAISFGMVSIPVKMYVAATTHALSFHLLHKKCLTRPKQVLHCEQDDEYFSIKDTVRAFEYGKDQYVVLQESDFFRVPVRTTHVIEILSFVKAEEIDPTYFYGSHYLEPEEFAAKPYCLLRESLRESGRIGIAKVSFQRREHLCCLRPLDKLLVLHTLHYQDEVLSPSEISIPEMETRATELGVARSLIDVMTSRFQPEQYKDEYRQALEKVVEAKIQGEEVVAAPEPKIEEVPDLMSALKASIEAVAARRR